MIIDKKIPVNSLLILALIFFVAGCSIIAIHNADKKYGESKVRERVSSGVIPGPNYYREVKPILDKRCAVCHSCYDAPCQINLASLQGIDRGANKVPVYNSERFFAVKPTRLFIDAATTDEWREKGFHPVLNERNQTADANTNGSTMYLSLLQKRLYPLPKEPTLSESFTLSEDHVDECPIGEQYSKFAEKNPLWGMPYGLPAISDAEFITLSEWLRNGALSPPRNSLPEKYLKRIALWEKFFNGTSNNERLMSRYIYEHLFLGHLYFDDLPSGEFFTLVRSKTPPGLPIEVIPTRRAFDDPGVDTFYYRLMREEATISAKTHMPYPLGTARMRRWTELFLDPKLNVKKLPSYDPEIAANPFLSFQDIPLDSRYRFMLDDAEFFVSGFIKGPVCHGNTAVNAIQDRFWIFFASPEYTNHMAEDQFLKDHSEYARLPSQEGSNALIISNWLHYSNLEKNYFNARKGWLEKHLDAPADLNVKIIWDGNKKNTSAALTVFRHYDSATVVAGLVGGTPKTVWILGYPVFERLHYLLVAGFDIFGNIGHQANSRLYMDFMRIEGEYNFLSLLPEDIRIKERDFWYRGASKQVSEYLSWAGQSFSTKSVIEFTTDNPKEELLLKAKKELGNAVSNKFNLKGPNDEESRILARLTSIPGQNASYMPQLSFLRINNGSKSKVFSLIHDSSYTNVATPLHESDRRLPNEDSIFAVPGLLGAYPNAFYDVELNQLSDFVESIAGINKESDYKEFVTKFGVRRTSDNFWAFSDWLHETYQKQSQVEAGLFDYSHFENR